MPLPKDRTVHQITAELDILRVRIADLEGAYKGDHDSAQSLRAARERFAAVEAELQDVGGRMIAEHAEALRREHRECMGLDPDIPPCAICGPQDRAVQGYDGADYGVGDRVELHPMMGDRYGDVNHLLKDGRVQVKTDKGATLKAFPHQFRAICLAGLALLLALPAFGAEPCKVNVNGGDVAALELLARTGPVLANRIAAGGPYGSLEQLDGVKGIGPAWLSVNGPHVAFEGQTTCTEKLKAATPKVAAPAPLP